MYYSYIRKNKETNKNKSSFQDPKGTIMTEQSTMVTGYQAAQVLNILLQEEGLEQTVRPQMIYNYVRKGLIESVDGKVDLQGTGEKSFPTWAKKYIEKKKNGTQKVTAQDLRALMNI